MWIYRACIITSPEVSRLLEVWKSTLFFLFNLDASEISKTVLNLLFYRGVSKLWAEYAEIPTNKVFFLHGNSFLMWRRRSLVIRNLCLCFYLIVIFKI